MKRLIRALRSQLLSQPAAADRCLAPLLGWLGHYFLYTVAIAVPLSAATTIAGRNITWLLWLTAAAWGVLVVALTADLIYHRTSLCERCIREAPALNPSRPVQRWKRALWFDHQRKLQLAILFGYFAWGLYDGRVHHEATWQMAGDIGYMIIIAVTWLITWQHRRLMPWCPYCHWGRGGYHETVPVPPGPGHTLSLPATRSAQ